MSRRLMLCTACATAVVAGCALSGSSDEPGNGIFVDAKVYDTQTLRTQLDLLSSRLGKVSGIDQSSLVSHLGTLQGASLSQSAASFQATTLASPSVATTALNATPSTVQTVGGTTNTLTPATVVTQGATANNATPAVTQTLGQGTGAGGTITSGSTQTVTTTVSNTSGTTSQTITTIPSNTVGTSNQTVTTTPSNTLQTVTTAPSVAPNIPALPSSPAMAMPSFSLSALDLLNEQMQLSYQIVNLQLLLQGALSDDYTVKGQGKRHVTFGFPIYITTPKRYRGDVAEVEISVCNPSDVMEQVDPTLQTIIPQEKTYNVANIVSKSTSLGVGAVIANVVNIGGNFSWTHQTYYLVKQQDTVALQRNHPVNVPPCPGSGQPVSFAWQFRPVLGQETIDQGARSTFAQISFPPSARVPEASEHLAEARQHSNSRVPPDGPAARNARDTGTSPGATSELTAQDLKAGDPDTASDRTLHKALSNPVSGSDLSARIYIRTCWRRYDRKSGIAGDRIADSCVPALDHPPRPLEVSTFYDTLDIRGIRSVDNGDGTITVTVIGPFQHGTRVALGEGYLDESVSGFENTGATLRFTAPAQLLALRGARLLSPDGNIKPLLLTQPDDAPSQYQGGKPPRTWIPGTFDRLPVLTDGGRTQQPERGAGGVLIDTPDGSDWAARYYFQRADAHHSRCYVPGTRGLEGRYPAVVIPYSDTFVKVSLPLWQCVEIGPAELRQQLVVLLGGRAFGLSDAPFSTFSPEGLSFLAPRSLVQGQRSLVLRRLFLDQQYETTYAFAPATISVTGITVAESTSAGTTFAITGSGLTHAQFELPRLANPPKCCDTLILLTLSAAQLNSLKQLVLQPDDRSAPLLVNLPSVTTPKEDVAGDTAAKYPIAILQSAKDSTTYAISAARAGASLSTATFVSPTPSPKIVYQDAGNLWFRLDADQVAAIKQIAIRLSNAPVPPPLILKLPAPPQPDKDIDKPTLTLKKDTAGIAQGSTGPLTIKGEHLELIATVRYLGNPLPLHFSADGTALTIDQLPPGLAASPGKVPLEIRLVDGSRQRYDILVNKP